MFNLIIWKIHGLVKGDFCRTSSIRLIFFFPFLFQISAPFRLKYFRWSFQKRDRWFITSINVFEVSWHRPNSNSSSDRRSIKIFDVNSSNKRSNIRFFLVLNALVIFDRECIEWKSFMSKLFSLSMGKVSCASFLGMSWVLPYILAITTSRNTCFGVLHFPSVISPLEHALDWNGEFPTRTAFNHDQQTLNVHEKQQQSPKRLFKMHSMEITTNTDNDGCSVGNWIVCWVSLLVVPETKILYAFSLQIAFNVYKRALYYRSHKQRAIIFHQEWIKWKFLLSVNLWRKAEKFLSRKEKKVEKYCYCQTKFADNFIS